MIPRVQTAAAAACTAAARESSAISAAYNSSAARRRAVDPIEQDRTRGVCLCLFLQCFLLLVARPYRQPQIGVFSQRLSFTLL
jgi:hypothetical protein